MRVLTCPTCGEQNLHHGIVEVRSRRHQDENGTRVVVDNERVLVEPMDASLFQGRRDEVVIWFTCEGCDNRTSFSLTILQHKGQSMIRTDIPPLDRRLVMRARIATVGTNGAPGVAPDDPLLLHRCLDCRRGVAPDGSGHDPLCASFGSIW